MSHGYKIPLLALCFIVSCYSYSPVRIVKRVEASRIEEVKKRVGPVRGSTPLLSPGREVLPKDKSEAAAGKKPLYALYVNKYFAGIRSFSPVARINNRGVEHALRGELREARLLFLEAIKEDAGLAAAYNNLGIVLELAGRDDEAFAMYSRACMLEPNNSYFKENFLYGVNDELK